MNGFTYRVVATERERHVGHAARGQGVRKFIADVGTGVDKVHSVVVVFFDAGGHGEDVRVEDDVFRYVKPFTQSSCCTRFPMV